jgi:hypothetical protein
MALRSICSTTNPKVEGLCALAKVSSNWPLRNRSPEVYLRRFLAAMVRPNGGTLSRWSAYETWYLGKAGVKY